MAEEKSKKTSAEKAGKKVNNKKTNLKKPSREEISSARGKQADEKPKRRLLFVVSECQPFVGTGGLGEVAGSLPAALAKKAGYEITVIMPLYKTMATEWRSKLEYIKYFYTDLAWRHEYCGVFSLERDDVRYIFLDNERYFGRDGLYGYYDDGERFAFFCKACMDAIYELDLRPDIVHANDWETALVPIYNTTMYRMGFKTVFTIHNVAYQGQYDLAGLEDVFGLVPEAYPYVEYKSSLNLMKGAIECSDIVSTVSPSYAKELEEGFFSYGMEDIIRRNSFKMYGILNGIDTVSYDPENDPNIAAGFSAQDMSGKAVDKQRLQEMLGLYQDPDTPIVAMITRLAEHKGLSLVRNVIENLLKERMQFVVLGVGEPVYEDYFRYLEGRYAGKVSANIMFNGGLSHRIYAGADMFLMPSLSEPCGLSQMISCRYGTVPVVRETGGLKDSIWDCSFGEGSGFTFAGLEPHELEDAVRRALRMYSRKDDWSKLRTYIMSLDFSWDKSADEYDEMYARL